jgi:hypothetical protein
MSNIYRTSILHKLYSKTVLRPGKNLYTTSLTYIVVTLIGCVIGPYRLGFYK